MGWYDPTWKYRVKVTVASAQVPGDLTGFPVYVNLAHMPALFFTHVRSDGGDIRVTSSDGTTEVPREVVAINTGSSSGELHFKGDLSSSADTDFFIYYGKASATEPAVGSSFGRNNTWTAYLHVYHLQAAATPTDSTGTTDGTNVNTTDATGQIGGGVTASQTGPKYIDIGGTGEHSNPLTVSAWIRPSAVGATQYQVASKGFDGTNTEWQMYLDTDSKMHWGTYNGAQRQVLSTATFSANVWKKVVGVYTGTAYTLKVDGGAIDSSAQIAPVSTAQKKAIGAIFASGSPTQAFEGILDEVRIAAAALSTDWQTAEWNNQGSPATFYTISAETPAPSFMMIQA